MNQFLLAFFILLVITLPNSLFGLNSSCLIDLALGSKEATSPQYSIMNLQLNNFLPLNVAHNAKVEINHWADTFGLGLNYEESFEPVTVGFALGSNLLTKQNEYPSIEMVYPSSFFVGAKSGTLSFKNWLLGQNIYSTVALADTAFISLYKETFDNTPTLPKERVTVSVGGQASFENIPIPIGTKPALCIRGSYSHANITSQPGVGDNKGAGSQLSAAYSCTLFIVRNTVEVTKLNWGWDKNLDINYTPYEQYFNQFFRNYVLLKNQTKTDTALFSYKADYNSAGIGSYFHYYAFDTNNLFCLGSMYQSDINKIFQGQVEYDSFSKTVGFSFRFIAKEVINL